MYSVQFLLCYTESGTVKIQKHMTCCPQNTFQLTVSLQ